MHKAKAVRIAGFVGALGASALLVGFAVNGTGAYFSDSHQGGLEGSAGHLQVNTSGENIDCTRLNSERHGSVAKPPWRHSPSWESR